MKQARFLALMLASTVHVTMAIGATASFGCDTPPSTQNESITIAKSRIAAYPEDSEAYRMLAAALVGCAEVTGDPADYDAAWMQLERAEALEPGSLQVLQTRAALLLSRHRFAQAKTLAEQGLERAPDDSTLLGIAGDGALEMGNFKDAKAHYQRLVSVAPKQMSSWAKMAHLAELQGNLSEAAELMETAINASYPKPLSPAAFSWARAILGEIEAKRGNLDEARKQYKWALYKSPDHLLALQFLAELDRWEGNMTEAEAGYRKILALKPDAKIKIDLADFLEQRGAKDEPARLRAEAYQFYSWAVSGGNEGYLRPLAILELAQGNYREATELAARDLDLRPTVESRAIYRNILKAAPKQALLDGTPPP